MYAPESGLELEPSEPEEVKWDMRAGARGLVPDRAQDILVLRRRPSLKHGPVIPEDLPFTVVELPQH
eukprot:10251902-Alexandrium_andersonii.AAC.1